MKTKIDANGKPYDPSTEARRGIDAIQVLIDEIGGALKVPADRLAIINRAMTLIRDRLCSCDAFEAKVERQQKAHAALVKAAAEYVSKVEVRWQSAADARRGLALADALTGVEKAQGKP